MQEVIRCQEKLLQWLQKRTETGGCFLVFSSDS